MNEFTAAAEARRILKETIFKKKSITAHKMLSPYRISLPKNPSMSLYDTESPIYTSPSPLNTKSAGGTPGMPKPEVRYCAAKSCMSLMKDTRYRNCEKCRQKEREKKMKKKEQGLLQGRVTTGTGTSQHRISATVASLFREKNLKQYMGQLRAKGLLTSAIIANMEGSSGKRKIDELAVANPSPTKKFRSATCNPEEYQTADDLYAGLRHATAQGSELSFSGHICVVRSLSEETTKPRARREVHKMVDKTGLRLRMEENPLVKMHLLHGELACRLEYRCACSSSCNGKFVLKMEKMVTGIAPGEKITARIRHA